MEPAWSELRLSVQIVTKLNRSHIVPGEVTYLLPCLGWIEIDQQASGPRAISIEDSTACIHGSRGQRNPVAETLLSEPKIVAALPAAKSVPVRSSKEVVPEYRRRGNPDFVGMIREPALYGVSEGSNRIGRATLRKNRPGCPGVADSSMLLANVVRSTTTDQLT